MSNPISLLDNQVQHYSKVIEILNRSIAYIDTSCMGTGKTYIAAKVAQESGYSLAVVCPLSITKKWQRVADEHGITVEFVHTYQKIRGQFTPDKSCKVEPSFKSKKEKKEDEDEEEEEVSGVYKNSTGLLTKVKGQFVVTREFREMVKRKILLVIDEFHNIKNASTQFRACKALVKEIITNGESRVALLSATPCDKEEHILRICQLLDFVSNKYLYRYNPGTKEFEFLGINELISVCKEINRDETNAVLRRNPLAPNRAQVLSITHELFTHVLKPFLISHMDNIKHEVSLDAANGKYNLSQDSKELLVDAIKDLKAFVKQKESSKTESSIANWGNITSALMRIENAKCEILLRKSREVLSSTNKDKVIIFVNYNESIDYLKEGLSRYDPLVLNGSINIKKREETINKFQNGGYRLIIANTKVGGVGIDLHDTIGDAPRHVFIIPTYSIIDIHQASHRVYRQGVKSTPIIRFVYGNVDSSEQEVSILNALARKSNILREVGTDNPDGMKLPGDYDWTVEKL